ncbi:CerR family C-terminal domain-containing protein [Bradyrhizobium neotropicale]|uniref:CerR family C-terminal domain-containing protein n=1 Tax=Bradyrhizobium neotropicale TaxID=1497615 RepID=UPI001AD6AB2E|nr:CerR family C-terminal domain-containing protein [Bradyrhizobium neotropicale]MBO4222600.1 CerR family C-terminal domain-containing protein [Bradyrhizobium neotropicale]
MAGLRRRKTETGYPRGEETRARIIRTALALFGERGFDGVSTRDIAAQAGVPAPSLQYYFESKEGLYAACIEDIQASANAAVDPALKVVDELLRSEANPGSVIDAYCSVLDGIADFLFASPDSVSRALFIARRIMPNKSALSHVDMSKSAGSRLHECCVRVIAYISGGDVAEEEARAISVTINGQLLAFHFSRSHLRFRMGYDEITLERLETIKRIVRRQTALLLKACGRKTGRR